MNLDEFRAYVVEQRKASTITAISKIVEGSNNEK